MTAIPAPSLDAESPAPGQLSPRRRVALVIAVGGALWASMVFTAIGPVLSAMAKALGGGSGGYWIAQLTMTIPDIGVIVGGSLAGLIVERRGARFLLLGALALYAVAGSAGLVIEDGVSLLSTRLLLGFASAGIATSTTALIGEWLDGQARVRAISLWNAFGSVGGIASALAAGRIAQIGGSWHTPFILYALAVVPLAAAFWAVPVRPAQQLADGQRRIREKPQTPSIRHLWPIYAAMIPIYAAVFMTAVQLSFLMAADGIDSPVVQSYVGAAASIGSVLGSLGFMQVRRHLSDRFQLSLLIGMMAAGTVLMPLTADPLVIAIGAAFNGAGGGMASPYFTAILIERSPVAARGRAIGLLFTMQYVGSFANPFVMTPLVRLLDIHHAFFTASALLLAGTVAAGLRRNRG